MNKLSGYLFPRQTFLTGVGRIFDFGHGLNQVNSSQSADEADARAIRADWIVVGHDLCDAINLFAEQAQTDQDFELE